MIDVNKLIHLDLKFAEKLVFTKNYDQINIIGNRILQNLFILNEKKLMAIGYIIKEMSMDLYVAQQTELFNDGILDNLEYQANECIGKMKLIEFSKQDISVIWKPYLDFRMQLQKYSLNDVGFDAYNTECDFCNYVAINYLDMLVKNRNQLLNKNFKFVGRVKFELSVILNTTGNETLLVTIQPI